MAAIARSKAASIVGAVLVLFALTFSLDTDGSLGTDTGGKLATIEAMVERGDWSADLGYWAEDVDADGSLHPFFGMRQTDKGWINVTSMPMILFGRALAPVLGLRGIFLFPILGTVLAGAGAAAMSLRLGGRSWHLAFWTVAMASPLLIYALDFWEHSMGVALMVWGMVFVLDTRPSVGGPVVASAAMAGACFGVAGTMRQESYIVGFVAGIVLVLIGTGPELIKRIRPIPGMAMVVGAALPFIANYFLEKAFFGGDLRGNRAVGVVAAGGRDLPLRLKEALITVSGPVGELQPLALGMAVLTAVGLLWLAAAILNGAEVQRPVALVGTLILFFFLRAFVNGPSFVPGVLAACPLAALGIVVAYRRRMYVPLALALGPVPLVLLFQYVGAALAQWGGRYLLTTGIVLSAIALSQFDSKSRLLRGFIVANVVLAGFGLSMVVARTHAFGSAHRELAARPEAVLVFNDPFIAREAAPLGRHEQWLSAFSDDDKLEASELLQAKSIDSFVFVAFPSPSEPVFPGYRADGVDVIEYGEFFPMELTSFVRTE